MNKIALLASPLLLVACAPMAMPVGTYPEGPARLGQTVYVGGPTVRPVAVIEDSRCPVSVTCVWAGRLKVRVEVGTGSGKHLMDVTLGEPVQVADGMLTLTDATPHTWQSPPIRPVEYHFTFKFEGGL